MKAKFHIIIKVFLILFFVFTQHQKNKNIAYTNSGIDFWEYQTVATNLAYYSQFPVLGFIGDKGEYFNDSIENDPKESYIFCRFEHISPIPFFEKPPFYGFVLGLSYKIFNNDLKIAYYLNLALFTLSFILLYSISKLFFKNSLFSILLVGLVLYLSPLPHLASVSPFYLMFLLFNTLTFFTYKYLKSNKVVWLVLYAVAFSLSLLTNGIYIFYLAFTLFILIFKSKPGTSRVLKPLVLFLSISLIVLPWLIFANQTIKKHEQAFLNTKKEILSSTIKCEKHTDELKDYYSNNSLMLQIVENGEHHNIISSFFDGYYSFKAFTFFSNQVKPSDFLAIHNELSIDGELHFEWEFDSNLFYNQSINWKNPSSFYKIFSFYKQHPSYIFKIYLAKTQKATQQFPIIYLIFLMIGLLIVFLSKASRKYQFLMFIGSLFFFIFFPAEFIILASFLLLFSAPIYLLWSSSNKNLVFVSALYSSLMVFLLFYGAERFIIFMLPFLALSSLSIMKQLLLNNTKN